ncbi:CBS domain-containing protein [Nitrosomonas sp. Nm51]|uniref:CBS domain-containing protein n=1 Tax=Nitrosomonas sp. Nm51 TaxID=133720 RepID=UPI0008C548D8|nr:CBS domain-containing protein [Nitrosomonas sp. Nm51]SER03099.1 CBS domain-containing protein [Nitrosomonas sp. Nm51]
MPVSELCHREVITMQKDESALEAARLMRKHHVGDVIIIAEEKGIRKPIGIVTDRDLVVEIMATELDPAVITAGDIMKPELATIKENTDVFEVIRYMRRKAVRRVPVINDDEQLVGIVTLDDLLQLLSQELSSLVKLVEREISKEIQQRP